MGRNLNKLDAPPYYHKHSSKERVAKKKMMNRYMRMQEIAEDDRGYKSNRKPTCGWEL